MTLPPAVRIAVCFADPGRWLSSLLDLAPLTAKISRLRNVSAVRIFEDDWLNEGAAYLEDLVAQGKADRVLWVGRFTPRQKELGREKMAAAGLNPYLQEWMDLSEQGIVRSRGTREEMTVKATVLLQMALARVRLLVPLSPVTIAGSDVMLIVGGGAAGLNAAQAMTENGRRVLLIEKESALGGKVARLGRLYPRICDPHCGLDFVIGRIESSPLAEIHTLTRPIAITGGPGNYLVRLRKSPRYIDETRCNACGECLKVCPAGPAETTASAIAALTRGRGETWIPPAGRAIHPPYPLERPGAYVIERSLCPADCSLCVAACPTGAVLLDQEQEEWEIRVGAVLLATGWDPYPLTNLEEYGYGRYPGVVSSLEMESLIPSLTDGLTVGFLQCVGSRDENHLSYCSAVCCSVSLKQIVALKKRAPETRCYIFYQDIRTIGLGEELHRQVRTLEGVTFVRATPAVVRPGDNGMLALRVEDSLSGKELRLDLDILVLAGGMTPSAGGREVAEIFQLPLGDGGFFVSHLPCRSEESLRRGIRVGGAGRGPMGIDRAIETAMQAAFDLLPFLGETVTLAPTIPLLSLAKCDKCKRCMEECPFGSFVFTADGFPAVDLGRCRQCGNCMGICPLLAVSRQHSTVEQMAAQIKALKPTFIPRQEPVILAFLCENDAYPAAVAAWQSELPLRTHVYALPVVCAGAVNNAFIADALALGIDGVLIGSCRDGQCHYEKGNRLVKTRGEDMKAKLQTMMIEPERVRIVELEIRDASLYAQTVASFGEELRKMGPNPFR